MSRGMVLAALSLWVGTTLLVAELRWFRRPSLVERLGPHAPGGGVSTGTGALSVVSFRDAIGPLSRLVGERAARLLGVSEELEVRLRRIHAPLDVTAFRVRQIGYCAAAFGVAALAVLALQPPPAVGLLAVLGVPLLAFLLVEQRLASASTAWQRRLVRELPIVAEQLAMLVQAGYSLTAAMQRVARRGTGACALDLRRLGARVGQGLDEADALAEWAAIANVDALNRLVPVLALNRETRDLGRLLAEEARSIRRDVHRELVEAAERRNQQVWIPVTVATLLPGAVFLAIPFIEALRLFGG